MNRILGRLLAAVALAAGLSACSAPTAEPVGPPATAVEPVAATPLPTGLDIPAIGVHVTTLADLGLNDDNTMQVPADAITTGWYAPGPIPGEPGPAIIAAHVNMNGQPGTFARLHELKAGDEVTIPREDGSTTAFTVDRVERFAKDTFPTEAVYGNVDRPELRLITCGGALDRATHSYLDNVVVFAHLQA